MYSNDDMDIDNSRSFITEHNSSFIVQPTEKKTIIFKIEDVEPPDSINNNPIPLPDNANLPRVIDNILGTLQKTNPIFKNNASASTIWKKYFEMEECQAILSDMFWFCLIKVDKRKHMKKLKKSLQERISSNYVQVFITVTRADKDIFFQSFYDCIAQGVFYSMFFSYPKSRSRLNSEKFKRKLFEIVSSNLTGIKVSEQGYKKWILDLGAGDVLKRTIPRSQNSSVILVAHPIASLKKQTRRTLQNLRYSPVVARHLQSKRYEAINSVPAWSMRYTRRNMDKEKELDKKCSYYRKLAVDTERQAKERNKELNVITNRIRREIVEEREKCKAEVSLLNARTNEIIKGGASEYANRLVALGIIQREEKKQGFIPL